MHVLVVQSASCSDCGSINTLVKKVGGIQELIKNVIKQAKDAKVDLACHQSSIQSVEASAVIFHQFKKVAQAMMSSSASKTVPV